MRDNVVLTERIDTSGSGTSWRPCTSWGTFEVRDGKICAWRDYFDLAQITAMLTPAESLRGLHSSRRGLKASAVSRCQFPAPSPGKQSDPAQSGHL